MDGTFLVTLYDQDTRHRERRATSPDQWDQLQDRVVSASTHYHTAHLQAVVGHSRLTMLVSGSDHGQVSLCSDTLTTRLYQSRPASHVESGVGARLLISSARVTDDTKGTTYPGDDQSDRTYDFVAASDQARINAYQGRDRLASRTMRFDSSDRVRSIPFGHIRTPSRPIIPPRRTVHSCTRLPSRPTDKD
jgi:hypothetical protein